MIYFCTGGMILMILTIVFVILLHIAVLEPNYIDTGIFIDRVFELSVLVIMKTPIIIMLSLLCSHMIDASWRSILKILAKPCQLFISDPYRFYWLLLSLLLTSKHPSWTSIIIQWGLNSTFKTICIATINQIPNSAVNSMMFYFSSPYQHSSPKQFSVLCRRWETARFWTFALSQLR